MKGRADNFESGFTLLEVLIAIALIASIAGAATLGLSKQITALQAKQEVNSVLNGLRKTRLTALKSGAEARAELDLDRRVLAVLPLGIQLDIPQGVELDITVDRSLAGPRKAAIVFYPDGTSTGADLRVRTRGYEYHIQTDWLTGLSRAERTVDE